MIRPGTRAAMLLSVASPTEPLTFNDMLDRLAETAGEYPDAKGAQYGSRILRAAGLLTMIEPHTGSLPALYLLTPAGERERNRLREVAA